MRKINREDNRGVFSPRERSLEMEDAKAAGTQQMCVVEQEDSCWAGRAGAGPAQWR